MYSINLGVLIHQGATHSDGYLDCNSNHPMSAKCAVLRALTDKANDVCSSPELLAEEMDHWARCLNTIIVIIPSG